MADRFVTKPSASSARARQEKDKLAREHRRGEHAETPKIKCPACHSAGAFRA